MPPPLEVCSHCAERGTLPAVEDQAVRRIAVREHQELRMPVRLIRMILAEPVPQLLVHPTAPQNGINTQRLIPSRELEETVPR